MAKFTTVSNGYTKSFQLPGFTKINWATVAGLAVDVVEAGDYAVLATAGNNGDTIEIDYQIERGYVTPIREKRISASLKILPSPGSQTLAAENTVGRILNTQLPALAPFFGVKLIFQNYDTVNPLVFDGVKVASAIRTAGGGGSQNNSALAFSPFVTLNGSQTITIPVARVGEGGQVIPTTIITDFVRVKSLTRTDVPSAPPLLRIAAHIPPSANSTVQPSYSGGSFVNVNALADANNFNIGNGSFIDSLANLTSINQPTFDIYGGIMNPIGAYFYYSTGVQEIAFFGDSVVQGLSSTGSISGFPSFLSWMTYNSKHPFSVSNYATSGQKTIDSLAVAKDVLSKTTPSYAMFKSWSPNDGDTQAAYDDAWTNTLEFIDICLSKNIVPIVMDSYPMNGYSLERIKAQNLRVANLPPSVVKLESYKTINSPVTDGVQNPLYFVDGLHLNNAGYKAIAETVIKTLSI